MLQKKYIGIVLLLLVAASASAQKAERDYIRKGNRFFKDSVYVDAEVNYRKALEVNPNHDTQRTDILLGCPGIVNDKNILLFQQLDSG